MQCANSPMILRFNTTEATQFPDPNSVYTSYIFLSFYLVCRAESYGCYNWMIRSDSSLHSKGHKTFLCSYNFLMLHLKCLSDPGPKSELTEATVLTIFDNKPYISKSIILWLMANMRLKHYKRFFLSLNKTRFSTIGYIFNTVLMFEIFSVLGQVQLCCQR